MTTYVRAARRRDSHPSAFPHVTGSVLHLAPWIYDLPHTTTTPGIGRYVPLCGGHRSPRVEAWRVTGPWAEGWEKHAHWPVCRDCSHELERLVGDLAEQLVRSSTDEQIARVHMHARLTRQHRRAMQRMNATITERNETP